MGVDDVQCQEVDMTVRVFYPWNAYKGVLPVLIRRRKVIGSLWTRTKSREPNTLGICRVTSGTHGFDLQHHDFTVLQPLVNIVDTYFRMLRLSSIILRTKFKPL
jgi:hypothetical protein